MIHFPMRCFVCIVFVTVCSSLEKTVDCKAGKVTGRSKNVRFGEADSKTTTEITTFLGIPYAQPPVGNLRFSQPLPKTRFSRIYAAVEFGASCLQNNPGFKPVKTNEDCLFLNIYTPDITGRAAVMVWIHGGGFILGDGRVFGGEILTAYSKVVVVTINYRLGPLGFMNTGDEHVNSNVGLYDQHLAIKWVHDNIGSFGGNPANVTIFGESAGAVSAIHQALYPENNELFQRVISESGSANLPSAMTVNPIAKAKKYALNHNCSTESIKEMVKCLRDLNANDVLDSDSWTPSYDGAFVTKERIDAIDNLEGGIDLPIFKKIDLMMGTNGYEGYMFLVGPFAEFYQALTNDSNTIQRIKEINNEIFTRKMEEYHGNHGKTKFQIEDLVEAISFQYTNFDDPQNKDSHIRQASDLFTDVDFFIPTYKTLQKHAQGNNISKTWQYEFNELYPFLPKDSWVYGAVHADDLPYVFGFPEDMAPYFGYNQSLADTQWNFSSQIMDYWSNFAKYGNPNSPNMEQSVRCHGQNVWNEYTSSDKDYIYLTSSNKCIENRTHLNSQRVEFWTKYIPMLIKRIESRDKILLEKSCNFTSPGYRVGFSTYIISLLLYMVCF